MIDKALKFTVATLDRFLAVRHTSDTHIAVLSNLTNSSGDPPKEIVNKIVVTVLNIERDATASASTPKVIRSLPEDGLARAPQDLALNVYVLVAASFDEHYENGLQVLSSTLGFFQTNPIITPQSHPDLPKGIRQLAFQLVNLDLQTLSHVWGGLGGRYMPSIAYKMRLLAIDEAWLSELVPEITGVRVNEHDAE